MLCRSCRRALSARLGPTLLSANSRLISTITTAHNAVPNQSTPSSSAPTASTPTTPSSTSPLSSPSTAETESTKRSALKQTKLKGSIPGGGPLTGLGYLKAKPHIYAMEDDQYPAWLWTLLDEGKTEGPADKRVDLNAMTKKQRGKYERKMERLMKDVPREIPLHEQSIDLTGPGEDAVTSLERRREVTRSSRQARRKEIKESNFLRSM